VVDCCCLRFSRTTYPKNKEYYQEVSLQPSLRIDGHKKSAPDKNQERFCIEARSHGIAVKMLHTLTYLSRFTGVELAPYSPPKC